MILDRKLRELSAEEAKLYNRELNADSHQRNAMQNDIDRVRFQHMTERRGLAQEREEAHEKERQVRKELERRSLIAQMQPARHVQQQQFAQQNVDN